MNAQPNPAAVVIDKQFLLALLQESRETFLDSFAGVTEEQSRLKPAPDCWCVLDTVEHLTSAETHPAQADHHAAQAAVGRCAESRTGLSAHDSDRSHKMQSPEVRRPIGRFATLAEAAEQFKPRAPV